MNDPRRQTTGSPPSSRSAKHAEARDALPEELLAPFDSLVEDYKFYASVHYGSRLVSYLILADLVRAGWRPPPANAQRPSEGQ
jgi:hypothetical protein